MRKKTKLIRVVPALILLLLTFVWGCGGSGARLYVRESANFQYINNIAVLPFNNMSDDKYAGEKVRSLVIMEILERGLFEVSEEGEVNRITWEVFREMGFREGDLIAMDIETIRRISERLGVQAVLIGSIESYGGASGSGGGPVIVSVSLRLIEGNSGLTLWRSIHTVKGDNVIRTIVGIDQKDSITLSNELVEDLIATLGVE